MASAVPGHRCAARRPTSRACLYGATVAFTLASSAFSIASSRACPPCSTTPPAMTVERTGAEGSGDHVGLVRADDRHRMQFIL